MSTGLTKVAAAELVDEVRATVSSVDLAELAEAARTRSERRLAGEIGSLGRRANLNLILGIVTAMTGAFGIRAKFAEATGTGCTPDEDTLCLVNGRFKVEIAWDTNTDSGTGQARTIPGVDFSGLFWFFNSDNLEMLVKVLDACALNQKFWVFFAATTNVGFDMTITDTESGVEKVYSNNRGTAAPPVQDTEAFSCAPAP